MIFFCTVRFRGPNSKNPLEKLVGLALVALATDSLQLFHEVAALLVLRLGVVHFTPRLLFLLARRLNDVVHVLKRRDLRAIPYERTSGWS